MESSRQTIPCAPAVGTDRRKPSCFSSPHSRSRPCVELLQCKRTSVGPGRFATHSAALVVCPVGSLRFELHLRVKRFTRTLRSVLPVAVIRRILDLLLKKFPIYKYTRTSSTTVGSDFTHRYFTRRTKLRLDHTTFTLISSLHDIKRKRVNAKVIQIPKYKFQLPSRHGCKIALQRERKAAQPTRLGTRDRPVHSFEGGCTYMVGAPDFCIVVVLPGNCRV